ncbi:MAG: NUDIX hydrolase [Pseudomonadota bacterium]
MDFCTQCGGPTHQIVPLGDNRMRIVCQHCHHVHYQNPKIVTGCLVHQQEKVLLCQRAINPRIGKWTVPAGFLENGESLEDGAARETQEEACAKVAIKKLYVLSNLLHVNQIYLLYRAELVDNDFKSGEETMDIKLVSEHEVPWDDIAFPTVKIALQRFFKDYSKNDFPLTEYTFNGQNLKLNAQ